MDSAYPEVIPEKILVEHKLQNLVTDVGHVGYC